MQESLHPLRPLTPSDERAGNVARNLHSMVQQICVAAVEGGAENHVHTILILAQAANGLLHMLARTSMPTEENERHEPISSTATLFAALLAYHTGPCEYAHGHVQAEFSPLVVFDALKDVEKVSGQRPDERLHEALCQVARECAADPAMVAQISRARSSCQRGNETLN